MLSSIVSPLQANQSRAALLVIITIIIIIYYLHLKNFLKDIVLS